MMSLLFQSFSYYFWLCEGFASQFTEAGRRQFSSYAASMRWAMTASVTCPWAPAKRRDQQGSSLYQANLKSTFEADWQLLYALFLYYTYHFDRLTRIEQLVTSTYALQDNMPQHLEGCATWYHIWYHVIMILPMISYVLSCLWYHRPMIS